MGRVSTKPEEVAGDGPVKDVDYHLIMVKAGESAPAGWYQRRRSRNSFTPETIKMTFDNINKGISKPGGVMVNYQRYYFMYLGPKPDKKWGPVCP